MSKLMVFTGNANPELAQKIAESLDSRMGNATVGQFSDGEIAVEINENVRGKDVFILQSTCAPTNDNLMELILMVDALRRASAARITAVVPYFGYARQDRRVRSARVPISAKVVADMMVKAGVDRVMTMDIARISGHLSVSESALVSRADNPLASLAHEAQQHYNLSLFEMSADSRGTLGRARINDAVAVWWFVRV